MTISEVKKVYTDAFPLPDDSVLDLAFAVVLNMYAKTDPLWLLIVGAPSSGKSEIIQAFYQCQKVVEISDLTENSFLSGMSSAENPPLLTQIGSYGTITMKDFTSMLSYRDDKKREILAQMRQIYDGYYSKQTGKSSKAISWKGKINFLGGVTEAIFTNDADSGSMGHRSIIYILPRQDRQKMMKAARAARKDLPIGQKRFNIQEIFAAFVNEHMRDFENMPTIPDPVSDTIRDLADFCTIARTPVDRDRFGGKEIIFVPDHEMPVRVSEQLHTFVETLMVLYSGEIPQKTYDAIYGIALNSIPKIRSRVLKILAAYDTAATRAIAVKLDFSTGMTKRALEELATLGIISRIASDGSRGDYWAMKEEYRALMQGFGGVEWIGGSLEVKDVGGGVDATDDVDTGYQEEMDKNINKTFEDF